MFINNSAKKESISNPIFKVGNLYIVVDTDGIFTAKIFDESGSIVGKTLC